MTLKVRKKLQIATAITAAAVLCIVMTLLFYRQTSIAEIRSINCPPDFPFEVVYEETSESLETKQVIIVLPKSEYTESNLNKLFICYSRNNPKARTLIARLFTDKALAKPGNFFVFQNWRHFTKAYPFDATLIRDYSNNGSSISSLDEYYEYRPITWFSFWTKRVIIKQNELIPKD